MDDAERVRVAQAGVAACRVEAEVEGLSLTVGGCYRLLYAALPDILHAATDERREWLMTLVGVSGSEAAARRTIENLVENALAANRAARVA